MQTTILQSSVLTYYFRVIRNHMTSFKDIHGGRRDCSRPRVTVFWLNLKVWAGYIFPEWQEDSFGRWNGMNNVTEEGKHSVPGEE